MVGLTVERSMRMKGKIGETEVIVLQKPVTSGATSNFISASLVGTMGLHVTETGGFGVSIGNGQIIAGRGKCSGVVLSIQGIEIVEEFLLFELGTTDVVLGYSWLATLGETQINWGCHTLSFKIHNQWVTLVGDPALLRAQVSLNSLEKVVNMGEIVCLLELSTLF